jgi:hypothetical protein
MKKMQIILFIFLFALCSCGQDNSDSEDKTTMLLATRHIERDWLNQEVRQWKDAELGGETITRQDSGTLDTDVADQIAEDIIESIAYEPDEDSYWQTSEETDTNESGDHIDIALMIYAKWREEGFPDDSIGVAKIKHNGNQFFAAVCQEENEVVVFAPEDIGNSPDLIEGFNFFDSWWYE